MPVLASNVALSIGVTHLRSNARRVMRRRRVRTSKCCSHSAVLRRQRRASSYTCAGCSPTGISFVRRFGEQIAVCDRRRAISALERFDWEFTSEECIADEHPKRCRTVCFDEACFKEESTIGHRRRANDVSDLDKVIDAFNASEVAEHESQAQAINGNAGRSRRVCFDEACLKEESMVGHRCRANDVSDLETVIDAFYASEAAELDSQAQVISGRTNDVSDPVAEIEAFNASEDAELEPQTPAIDERATRVRHVCFDEACLKEESMVGHRHRANDLFDLEAVIDAFYVSEAAELES